jgi:hypothetical protein
MTITGNSNNEASSSSTHVPDDKKKGVWLFRFTMILLLLDIVVSCFVMSPFAPSSIRDREGELDRRYKFSASLEDLFLLASCRVTVTVLAFLIAYWRGQIRTEYPFEIYHPNGTKKTKDELEEEALEQSFGTWLWCYVNRAAFPSELFALVTTLLSVVKCLVRLNVEIGLLRDAEPMHPVFWCAILFAAIVSALEMICCDRVCMILSEWGHIELEQGSTSFLRQISSHLSLPLLANDSLEETDNTATDEEGPATSNPENDEYVRGVSDIGGDTDYKASWIDLLHVCIPDAFLILIAFVFLLLAAAAQIYIPRFTGAILDALEEAYSNHDDNNDDNANIKDVPGFMSNVRKLIVVSILGGIFSGVRGSVFTLVGGRVNVRLRLRLMDNLLTMEQGFFDVTKTGDITSRLSSDTTLVGNQLTYNVNVSHATEERHYHDRR